MEHQICGQKVRDAGLARILAAATVARIAAKRGAQLSRADRRNLRMAVAIRAIFAAREAARVGRKADAAKAMAVAVARKARAAVAALPSIVTAGVMALQAVACKALFLAGFVRKDGAGFTPRAGISMVAI